MRLLVRPRRAQPVPPLSESRGSPSARAAEARERFLSNRMPTRGRGELGNLKPQSITSLILHKDKLEHTI
jgi:hypothetical protein